MHAQPLRDWVKEIFSVRDLLITFLAFFTLICFLDWWFSEKWDEELYTFIFFLWIFGLLFFVVWREVDLVFWPNRFWPNAHFAILTTKNLGFIYIPYLGYLLNCGYWFRLFLGMVVLISYIALCWVVTFKVVSMIANFVNFLVFHWREILIHFFFLFILCLYMDTAFLVIMFCFSLIKKIIKRKK